MINENNWSYCSFQLDELKATISFGGEPAHESDEKVQWLYFLTLAHAKTHEEVFQETFIDLSQAIKAINTRYLHWKFLDGLAPNDSGGCSTCAAH